MLAVGSSQPFVINSVILWSIINQAQLPKKQQRNGNKLKEESTSKDVAENNRQERWDRQTACLGFVRNNLFRKHFKNIRPKDPIAFFVFLWISFMAVLGFLLVLIISQHYLNKFPQLFLPVFLRMKLEIFNFLESRYCLPLQVDKTWHTTFLFAVFCTGKPWDWTSVTSQNSKIRLGSKLAMVWGLWPHVPIILLSAQAMAQPQLIPGKPNCWTKAVLEPQRAPASSTRLRKVPQDSHAVSQKCLPHLLLQYTV